MKRLFSLTIPAVMIFAGFPAPFLLEGAPGLIAALVLVVTGAGWFWRIEVKTRRSLEEETTLNRVIEAEGKDLIEK